MPEISFAHAIVITREHATCYCGWSYIPLRGGDARQAAEHHARSNRPAIIHDYRFDKKEAE